MNSKIMHEKNMITDKEINHLERPGQDRTFCGKKYNEDWKFVANYIVGEEIPENIHVCKRCQKYASDCLKREKGDKWKTKSRGWLERKSKWGNDLNGRSFHCLTNILIWDLKVSTYENVNDFADDEVKTLLKKALHNDILHNDLTRYKHVGKVAAREIELWLNK